MLLVANKVTKLYDSLHMLANELSDHFQSLNTERLVVLGAGLPGLGKSEIFSEVANAQTPPALHLSDKAIKEMLIRENPDFVPASRRVADKKIRHTLKKTATEYLQAGGSVIVDIGHTNVAERRSNAEHYRQREFGAGAIVAVYFMVEDIETVKDKVKSLDLHVREPVLDSMLTSLQLTPPTCREGFDEVITIDANGSDFHILDIEHP